MVAATHDVVVREARREDAPGIARVYVDTWRDTYDGVLPVGYLAKLSVTTQAKAWAQVIRARHDVVLVADSGGEVIGFASGGVESEHDAFFRGEVFTLYVHPSAQRRGVGAELLVEMLRALQGLAPILVWVLDANEGAKHFYEELGGVPVRRGTATVGGAMFDKVGFAFFDI